jgi:hypothetical protein
MVQFPHGNRDPLRITEYLPGEQTKVKVVRHQLNNRPAEGWSVDPTVWFVGQLCTMSSYNFGSNLGPNEGMVVADVDLTSDPAIITVDWPTPGAPVWTAANLGVLAVVPHLKVGNMPKMRLTGQCQFGDWPNMQNYGNAWPDEGPGSGPRWAMCVVNGFGTFTPEEVDQYGSITFSGPAPWLNIALCNEIGAHPMFYMSQCAMHSTDLGGAQGASANYLPTTNSIGNYARVLAQLCKNTLNLGLIPIFEGPYEITSLLGGVWYSTQHGWAVDNRVFGQDARANLYMCSALSLLGQTVAEVYNTPKSEVHHQNKYRVAMLLPPDMMSATHNSPNGQIQIRMGINTGANPWRDRGGEPPLDWITHFCMHGYYAPAYHTVDTGERMDWWNSFARGRVEMMSEAFAAGNPTTKDRLVAHYVDSANPERWSNTKQYAGPQADGTTDVVYWYPRGLDAEPVVYLAKQPSQGREPVLQSLSQNDDYWQQLVDTNNGTAFRWALPTIKWALERVKALRSTWAPDVKIMGYIGGMLMNVSSTWSQNIFDFLEAAVDHPDMKEMELMSLNTFNEPGVDFPAVTQLAYFGGSGVQPGDRESLAKLLPGGVHSNSPRYQAVVEFNRSEEDDLVFPSSPTVGQIYARWRWDGRKWVARFSHPTQ